MTDISNFIHPAEDFQYSVNIAYDIYRDDKVKGYILSQGGIRLLEEFIGSTADTSSNRAHILTGAYGKGKSHFVLYLAALLSGRKKSLFKPLVQKAKELDGELADRISAYLKSGKRLLPVVIDGNGADLATSLLQGLEHSLGQAKLSDVMPGTVFEAATEKIRDWKVSYPDTYFAFERLAGQDGESFVRDLKSYSADSYRIFLEIHPKITAGSEFNPHYKADVVSVYEATAREIRKYGYSGIFILYDEFGKYLEGITEKYSSMDIKLLQDLAEKCARSGAEQLHLLLVSHKNIDNYVGQLPKVKVDAWKAVSNRFRAVTIENRDSEIYDIIGTVLKKDEAGYAAYREEKRERFEILQKEVAEDHRVFGEARNILGEELVFRTYPLHPYSLVLLPKISELVAQNERTIFTFLSSAEKYTVTYFLRTNTGGEFPLIEPDYIYDYFEKLFRNEPFGSRIQKQWEITTDALAKIRGQNNPLAEKILKTIALIYCVNDFETVPPSWTLIEEIYGTGYSCAEIREARAVLKNAHLLIELLYRPYVRITENSGHDVIALVDEESYRIKNKTDVKAVLSEVAEMKFFYPTQYNDENSIIRYFELRFLQPDEFGQIEKEGYRIDSRADGIIGAVLYETEEEKKAVLEAVSSVHNKRMVFIVPERPFVCRDAAIEYRAVRELILRYTGQETALLDELTFVSEDRESLLREYLQNAYLRPESGGGRYYYGGKEVPVRRKSQLSRLLSDIMESIYDGTPCIVNELINRNRLTGAIRGARLKILRALLEGNYKKNLGITGNGPELNILWATLISPGILDNENEIPVLRLTGCDEKFERVLGKIRNFVSESSRLDGQSFRVIYDVLTLPENRIGLKRGVVPIYLAVVLSFYREYAVIREKDREYPLTGEILQEIDVSPQNYSLLITEWNAEKEKYLRSLERIFAEYVRGADRTGGIFSAVGGGMRRWYLSLSRFETSTGFHYDGEGGRVSLERGCRRLRFALSSPDVNFRELLLEKLPACFSLSPDAYRETAGRTEEAVKILEGNLLNCERNLILETKQIFSARKEESLVSAVANYYNTLQETTIQHSFSGKCNLFLDAARDPGNDDVRFLEKLAKVLTNLRISDFTDGTADALLADLKAIREQIDRYDTEVSAQEGNGAGAYRISFTNKKGEEIVRQFDEVELSRSAQYFRNDLTSMLEEYGQAVSSDEKRLILFNLLKDLV